jgi:L-rhamnonate dehydratase
MTDDALTPAGRDRRDLIAQLAVGVPVAGIAGAAPLAAQTPTAPVVASPTAERDGRIVESIDVLRVSGPMDLVPGEDRQFQVNPLHVYDARRPAPYKPPAPGTKPVRQTRTQYYIRLRTKSGLEALYGEFQPECVEPIRTLLGRYVNGQDALAVETIWDQMYRGNRHARFGHYMMAMSMIDCVLWDWRGRYYKAPVYELLGGATRNPVKAYGSCLGFDVEPRAMAAKAKALYAQGWDHQKWFFSTGPGDGAKGLNAAIDMVKTLREALGRDAEIAFDAYQGWDLQFARRWASAVEPYRPYWLEEAFPAADIDSFAALGKLTTVPIATGEHVYNRWETHQYLKQGAVQIIQADPEWCGGVSELVKICTLASTYGAKVIPHGHNVHAALHVIASQSPAVCPLLEYLLVYMPDKTRFQKNPPVPVNGHIALPTAPGFGIELDQAKIEKIDVLPVSR